MATGSSLPSQWGTEHTLKKITDSNALFQDIVFHMWEHIADVDCEECNKIMEKHKAYVEEYKNG